MATDLTKLQGETVEDPENQIVDVQRMLAGFLRALLDEQKELNGAESREKNQ